MNPHRAISSYLADPHSVKQKITLLEVFSALVNLRRTSPHIISRFVGILLLWSVVVGAYQVISTPHNLPGQTVSVGTGADASLPAAGAALPANFVNTAQHASVLAVDPTGQMLPPIAMAPPGTFGNSYSSGECTWYVASRRQVPRNWGNANTWYARAASAGWSVGSIPAIGAIAQTSAGSLGHVALVEQISVDYQSVYVSEMNYVGRGVRSYRWTSASSFHYIY